MRFDANDVLSNDIEGDFSISFVDNRGYRLLAVKVKCQSVYPWGRKIPERGALRCIRPCTWQVSVEANEREKSMSGKSNSSIGKA